MRIPVFIIVALVGAFMTLQGWTLLELVKLKVEFATLNAVVAGHIRAAGDITQNARQ